MLKLLKMDLKLLIADKHSLFRGMIFLFILFVFAMAIDIMNIILLFVPIMLVMFSSFEINVKESVARNYSMIQSLPVKRWEYVISKYYRF